MKMIRNVLTIIITAMLLIACTNCSAPQNHEIPLRGVTTVQEELLRQFVYIDSTRGTGNGVAVSEDLVLTNWHVCMQGVPQGQDIFGVPISFDLVDFDMENDLCLIRSTNKTFRHYVDTIVVHPNARTNVHNVCTPRGIFNSWPDLIINISEGYYLGPFPEQEGMSYYDIEATSGCSGSGIVDGEGRLLGIVTTRVVGWERGVLSPSGQIIANFLWRNGVEIELVRENQRIIINNDVGLDAE